MFAYAGLAALNSPLVYQAASTVAKKAFEAVAARSLKGITEIISERFKGDAEVLRLRDELELKVRVLSLPIDICVQHVVRGNSALQGALDVALKVLRDIEDFEAGLREQDISAGRGQASSTPDPASIRAAARRLDALIKQLDSLLPYLGVAISAVGLMDAGDQQPSPSRLMAASWHIRSPRSRPSEPVFEVPHARWHKEGLAAAQTSMRPMQEHFPLASVCIRRAVAARDGAEDGADAATDAGASCAYELRVEQDLDDGMHHEDNEVPGSLHLRIADILAIDWATSQSLKLGDNDFSPALVLHVLGQPGAGDELRMAPSDGTPAEACDANGASSTPTAGAKKLVTRSGSRRDRSASAQAPAANAGSALAVATTPSTPRPASASSQVTRYAVQCATPAESDVDKASSSADWQTLSEFEYVLRLCMLEAREELPHERINDERIRMAFMANSAPGLAADPRVPPGSMQLGQRTPSTRRSGDIEHLSRDLSRLGFGSPVT